MCYTNSMQVVVKRPRGSKHSVHYLTPSMKKLGKSVGRRNSRSVARQVVNHRRIREYVLRQLGRLIRKDMEHMCSTKKPSMLRKGSLEAMKSFCWEDLVKELENSSPLFCQLLRECVTRKRRKASKRGRSYAVNDSAVIGVCAAILLHHRNANMNLVQRIVSALLYSGHAPKQVIRNTCMITNQ